MLDGLQQGERVFAGRIAVFVNGQNQREHILAGYGILTRQRVRRVVPVRYDRVACQRQDIGVCRFGKDDVAGAVATEGHAGERALEDGRFAGQVVGGATGVAAFEAFFIDEDIGRDVLRARTDGRAGIGQDDGESRGVADVAVTVGDRVGEGLGDRLARRDVVVRGVDQLSVHDGDRAAEAARADDDGRGAGIVRAVFVVGQQFRYRADDHVFRSVVEGGEQAVVLGKRVVVDDVDMDGSGIGIALRINDRDLELDKRVVARGIVVERVGIGDRTGCEVDRIDHQHAVAEGVAGDEGLEDDDFTLIVQFEDVLPVDQQAIRPVGRNVEDGTGGRFAIGLVPRAGGFAVAHREPVLIDDRAVARRGDEGDLGHPIDEARDDLLIFGLGEEKLGVGQEVADIVSVLDRADRIGEVTARAARSASGRFGRLGIEQGRQVHRRDGDAVDDDLGHVDRAVDDDHLGAVGQLDDKIVALHVDIVERHAGGKDEDVFARRIGDHALDVAGSVEDRRRLGQAVGFVVTVRAVRLKVHLFSPHIEAMRARTTDCSICGHRIFRLRPSRASSQ